MHLLYLTVCGCFLYVSWLLEAVCCAHEPVCREHTCTYAWSYIHICIAHWQCICVCMWMYFCPEYIHMCIPESSAYLYVSDCISRSHTCTNAYLRGCSAVAWLSDRRRIAVIASPSHRRRIAVALPSLSVAARSFAKRKRRADFIRMSSTELPHICQWCSRLIALWRSAASAADSGLSDNANTYQKHGPEVVTWSWFNKT